MGRPREMDGDRRSITVRIPVDMWDRIDYEAEQRGVSRTKIVFFAVRDWLAQEHTEPQEAT